MKKLASSRGQSSPTIAAAKPTSLLSTTTSSGKHEAERQRSREDNVDVAIEPDENTSEKDTKKDKISDDILSTDLGPLRSRFENCKEFLRKAYTAHPPAKVTRPIGKIPCSKSASNIHSYTLEGDNSKESLNCRDSGGGLKAFARDDNCIKIEEESLDEVEIVSLLEEKVPKYKLRADCITKFGGKCMQ